MRDWLGSPYVTVGAVGQLAEHRLVVASPQFGDVQALTHARAGKVSPNVPAVQDVRHAVPDKKFGEAHDVQLEPLQVAHVAGQPTVNEVVLAALFKDALLTARTENVYD